MKECNVKIYKLHFSSPIHISGSREDYDVSLKTIQSDTIYAAVYACLAKLGVELPADGNLGCTVSSLFPFYQKDNSSEAIYFFPKPALSPSKFSAIDDMDIFKKIKKVSWVDSNYFQKMINGDKLIQKQEDIENIKFGDFFTSADIEENFLSSEVSSRVTISRTGDEESVPYYVDRIYFKNASGLYFIIEGDTTLFEKGLKLLQHEGIGTDRNVGNGFFSFQTECITINCPIDANAAMSLSVFIPEGKEQLKEMLNNEVVSYELVRRGGWITTPPHNTFRKNAIYAFLPASIFNVSIKESNIRGALLDIKPNLSFKEIEHPIWRNGKSIFLPIKI